jgi:hypothetical protein
MDIHTGTWEGLRLSCQCIATYQHTVPWSHVQFTAMTRLHMSVHAQQLRRQPFIHDSRLVNPGLQHLECIPCFIQQLHSAMISKYRCQWAVDQAVDYKGPQGDGLLDELCLMPVVCPSQLVLVLHVVLLQVPRHLAPPQKPPPTCFRYRLSASWRPVSS